MKFLSIAYNNLCSTWNDSFQTANYSSSLTVVKMWIEVWPAKGAGGEGNGSACLQSKGNLLVTGLVDKMSCSHKRPHGFCCIHGCVGFHLASLSWCTGCSQKGKGSPLIRRLTHIPSELERIEVSMWRVVINIQAVSPAAGLYITTQQMEAATRPELLRDSWVVSGQGTKFIPISILM